MTWTCFKAFGSAHRAWGVKSRAAASASCAPVDPRITGASRGQPEWIWLSTADSALLEDVGGNTSDWFDSIQPHLEAPANGEVLNF